MNPVILFQHKKLVNYFQNMDNNKQMKIEIEEHDMKSKISPRMSALYFAEKNLNKIQECHKLEERNINSHNSTITRQVPPTEITDNVEQSQLAMENVQVINLNFNQGFNEIKVDEDINEHLMYKRYIGFMHIFRMYELTVIINLETKLVIALIYWE